MAEKLQRIFDYRVLAASEELNVPLTEEEHARRVQLARQLGTAVPALDERDPYTLLIPPLPVEYVYAGRFGAGEIRNASGGGVALSTQDPPALDQRVILHVADLERGIEYTFPGSVVSRVLKGVPSMGVAFRGMPTHVRLGGRSGVYRTCDDEPTKVGRRHRTSG